MHADDLIKLYAINEAISTPDPRRILIVDDVLTTGSHFVAMKNCSSPPLPRRVDWWIIHRSSASRR